MLWILNEELKARRLPSPCMFGFFLLVKSWVFRNSFKSTVHNNIIDMEIFDLEGKGMEEKKVSEVLSLLWSQLKHLDDIEVASKRR